MSMEMMKKAAFGAATAIALFSAASAQAVTVVSPGTYTFAGETTLRQYGIPVTCHLTLVGDVAANGDITVESGSVSGSGTYCNNTDINLRLSASTPWTAVHGVDYTAPANPPGTGVITGTINGLNIDGPLGECSGGSPTSITVDYSNGDPTSDPSYFDFVNAGFGICSVTGTLEVQNADVNVYTP